MFAQNVLRSLFYGSAVATLVACSNARENTAKEQAERERQALLNDTAYQAQRKALQCTGSGAVTERRQDYVSRNLLLNATPNIFYFDNNKAVPSAPPYMFRDAIKRFDLATTGFRLVGCSSREQGSTDYNFSLSEKRVENVAEILKKTGVPNGNICKVPVGADCFSSERSVRIEAYRVARDTHMEASTSAAVASGPTPD